MNKTGLTITPYGTLLFASNFGLLRLEVKINAHFYS